MTEGKGSNGTVKSIYWTVGIITAVLAISFLVFVTKWELTAVAGHLNTVEKVHNEKIIEIKKDQKEFIKNNKQEHKEIKTKLDIILERLPR